MRRGLWVGIGFLVVLFVIALLVFGSFVTAQKTMVAKQEAVRASVSQINVDLQRRADLIPNLVATVKGYAKHEETVFGDIANARAGLLNAQGTQNKLQADTKLEGAIGRLLVLSENYPDLKSNQNFLQLQDQIEGSENRISTERRRSNLARQDYNTYIRQFPNSIWASMAGFQVDNGYFQEAPGAQNAPVVSF
jgi:LemA protein